jgi:hypothetical protein
MHSTLAAVVTLVSSLVSISDLSAQDRPSRLCQPDSRSTAGTNAEKTVDRMAWLAGVWIGSSGTATIEERWTPPAGGSMLAVSRTLKDNVMNAFEFLCIVERDGGLVYTAMPNGRMPATDFKLTQLDANGATFENPAHDFPKMIRYSRRDDGRTLEAVVSGASGENAQRFVFKRQP